MKLNKVLSIVSIILMSVFFSCQNDLDEFVSKGGHDDGAVMTFKMALDVTKTEFDASESDRDSRAVSYNWKEGDAIYLRFHKTAGSVRGNATYDSLEKIWNVKVYGSLEANVPNKVEVFYFKDAPLTVEGSVALSNSIAVYHDLEGSYQYTKDEKIFMSAHLKPMTSRIRFKGKVGKLIEVEGLEYLTAFDISQGIFSKSHESTSIRVLDSGYTDYIYGVLHETSEPRIVLCHNVDSETYQFTAKSNSKMMQVGKSGWMDIPNLTESKGWQVKKLEHGWVDMGLSVKWGTCNVGASAPEENGNAYSWGEITPKGTKGVDAEDITGDSRYDAARSEWGESWRMPTVNEFRELIDNTTCEEYSRKGVYGFLIKSKITGESMFLPAISRSWTLKKDSMNLVSTLGTGTGTGDYWSSTTVNGAMAYYVEAAYTGLKVDSLSIHYGLAIRPVRNSNENIKKVGVTTGGAQNVTSTTADVSAFFVNVLQKAIYGIEYVYNLGLDNVKKEKNIAVDHDGEFKVTLDHLYAKSNYSYRAFAKFNGRSVYGDYRTFTTEDAGTLEPFVDLGLSVKWATCNIGASRPEDFGDYYAWGETTTKTIYSESNSLTYGLTLGCISGNSMYDVARAKMGESWRVPTVEEYEELIKNCTSTWTTRNGVSGRLMTSKINGKSIFLPEAGFWTNGTFIDQGGFYSSGTPVSEKNTLAYFLHFAENEINTQYDLRSYGFSVRPVFGDKEEKPEPQPGFPDFSSENSPTWYFIKFMRDSICMQDKGEGENVALEPQSNIDAQRWQLIGNENSFILKSKVGRYVHFGSNGGGASNPFFSTSQRSEATDFLVRKMGESNFEIEVKNSGNQQSCMNQGPWKGLCTWTPGDKGNLCQFVTENTVSVVTTGSSHVKENTVNISATFKNISKTAICGIEYKDSTNVCQEAIIQVDKDGEYTITLKELAEGMSYQYRAFVRLGDKSYFGEYKQFTTRYKLWVDLGLSVKWAAYNVGASAPEEYGDYFAWGEIEPKSKYTEENSLTYGKNIGNIAGNVQYDAAAAKWGAPARLPTNEEIKELKENSTITWTVQKGITGRLIVSKKNGKSVFLPAAGYRYGTSSTLAGKFGYYWSDKPSQSFNYSSYYLNFSSDDFMLQLGERDFGCSVRPVRY